MHKLKRTSTELQKLKGGFDCNLGDFPADVLSNSCRTQREYMGDNQGQFCEETRRKMWSSFGIRLVQQGDGGERTAIGQQCDDGERTVSWTAIVRQGDGSERTAIVLPGEHGKRKACWTLRTAARRQWRREVVLARARGRREVVLASARGRREVVLASARGRREVVLARARGRREVLLRGVSNGFDQHDLIISWTWRRLWSVRPLRSKMCGI
ncbi:uncharacterized protein [Lolium perenne]|uniref:uncharacterized protein n=1 Tax=Lolium perenne TaxID=4522 RepID=UPI0021F587EE|nr:uncharacterized protein LOC127306590 isoform X2 [Lolium perenne]